jgi:hypothetical protein
MSFSGRLARAAFSAAFMVLLSACTHGSNGCVAIPAVFNGPIVQTPTLVSPVSGATGVSTGPLDVTIGNAISATSLFLKDGSGNVTFATNFRQANPPANDVRVGTFTQLASLTTYQVYASIPQVSFPNGGCSPTPALLAPQSVLLGSFTTR